MIDVGTELAPRLTENHDLGKYAGVLASASSPDQLMQLLASTVRDVLGADGAAIVPRRGAQCFYVEDADVRIWNGRCISVCSPSERDELTTSDLGTERQFYDPAGYAYHTTRLDGHQEVSAFCAWWSIEKLPTTPNLTMVRALCDIAEAIYRVLRHEKEMADKLRDAAIRVDEIRHRLKNAYASSIGLASLSMGRDAAASFTQRLRALSGAFDYLDGDRENQAIELAGLLTKVVEAFNRPDCQLISLFGPIVHISAGKVAGIGLIVNELAMNAMKYGALSAPRGRIRIAWATKADRVSLEWIEYNGPSPNVDAKAGTGSDVIQRLATYHLAGTFEREFTQDGVVCRISFDADPLNSALQ
jgi:two-component sensor histidine kinase